MLCYSTLFGRWAGWAVSPRNYILAGSHIFNVLAQTNQLRRCLQYKVQHSRTRRCLHRCLHRCHGLPRRCHPHRKRSQIANGGDAAAKEVKELATNAAIGGAVVATCVMFSKNIQVGPFGRAWWKDGTHLRPAVQPAGRRWEARAWRGAVGLGGAVHGG